jgi:hypothetical protein
LIEVESYLRAKDGQFTRVEDAQDAPPDPRHVEGALMLKIDHVTVIDTEMWDDVDELWAYIATMVSTLNEKDEASTYFPDQPIKLTFRRQGNGRIVVTADPGDQTRTANASERELVAELQSKGSLFFAKLSDLLPDNRTLYANSLDDLMSYQK